MTARPKHENPSDEQAAMFRFLDAYDNHVYSGDVGALLGQLAMLRERTPFVRVDEQQWHEAVSLAVTVH